MTTDRMPSTATVLDSERIEPLLYQQAASLAIGPSHPSRQRLLLQQTQQQLPCSFALDCPGHTHVHCFLVVSICYTPNNEGTFKSCVNRPIFAMTSAQASCNAPDLCMHSATVSAKTAKVHMHPQA